jgi:hypothetical protein
VAILRLRAATTELSLSDYDPRPDLERSVREYADAEFPYDCTYMVVLGAEGVGRSTVVRRSLAGRKGVVHVSLTNAD